MTAVVIIFVKYVWHVRYDVQLTRIKTNVSKHILNQHSLRKSTFFQKNILESIKYYHKYYIWNVSYVCAFYSRSVYFCVFKLS